jgi:hypothetical protein
MPTPAAQSFDFLTGAEAEYVQPIMAELAGTTWAKPLLAEIEAAGGLKTENKAKLFELRFGHALHGAGVTPQYELPGEGRSRIDYGFPSGGREFLVEMMRLEETDAVRAATTTKSFDDGATMMARHLRSNADDARQTPEGETLMAVQRICQKLEKDGKPHKFPPPAGKTHVLLVDFRTFKNGGDVWDRLHVGLGGESVPDVFKNYFSRPTRRWRVRCQDDVERSGRGTRTSALRRVRERKIPRGRFLRLRDPVRSQPQSLQDRGRRARGSGRMAARPA